MKNPIGFIAKVVLIVACFFAVGSVAAQSWSLTNSPVQGSVYPISFTTGSLSHGSTIVIYSQAPGSSTWNSCGGGGGQPGNFSITASGNIGFSVPGTWTFKVVNGGTDTSPTLSSITRTAAPNTIATSFSFSNLSFNYDGSTKTATVTPSPSNATYTADLTKGPGVGSYTVSATATGSFSGSGSATLTIAPPPNSPPTISWASIPATAYVNQWFTVQARGDDPDGNISTVYVWRDGQPFAFNGFPNGHTQYSDNNAAMSSVPGTITFMAQSTDASGATSGYIYYTVTIVNRDPTVTISTSPSTINFGQTTTATAVATDLDGNLAFHGILVLNQASDDWNRGTMCDHSTGWGNHPTTTAILSASYTSGVCSGSTNTEWIVHQPQWLGTITYHSNTHDGIVWASSDPANWATCTGYATVTVAKATPIWTLTNQSFAGPHTITSGDLAGAFSAFRNPYSGSVTQPSGSVAYAITSATGAGASPTGPITAGSTVLQAGTYTITASYAGDGFYNATTGAVTFTAVPPPVASTSWTSTSIYFGQSASATMTLTQSSPGSLTAHWPIWDGGVNQPWSGFGYAWSYPANTTGLSAISDSGGSPTGAYSSTKTFTLTPWKAGSFTFLNYGQDNYGTVPNWNQTTVVANQPTPNGTFANRTLYTTAAVYSVLAADLNAAFANPYSGSVAPPTGGIAYLIIAINGGATSQTLTPGTSLNLGSTYTLRASYPGDSNYVATAATATWIIGSGDPTPPSIPTGLTASGIANTMFVLSWTASTDNVGVTGYEVFKDGVSYGTTAATSLNITTLLPGTTYSMTVRARDAVGNWSAQSTAESVTTTTDPNADADGDGIPDMIEMQLGTNPNAASSDPGNTNQLKINTPHQ